MGPVKSLDRAFAIVRNAGAPALLAAWLGGGLVAGAIMGSYYIEWVEGVHSLRPLLALGLVLAWWARASLLAFSASAALRAAYGERVEVKPARPADAIRLASVVMVGLWPWLWLPLSGIWIGWWVLLLFPLLALRGGVAPSWIARAGCSESYGLSGFREAFVDSDGERGVGAVTELLILTAMLPFAMNLFGLFAFLILIGRSFLGLDVVLVESFLSPANAFVVLMVACLSAVTFEPLRVGWSVVSFVEARARRDGFDVRERVRIAVDASPRREQGRGALAILLVLTSLTVAPPVSAQELFSEEAAPFEEAGPYQYNPTEDDLGVHAELDEILARSEFREFDDERDRTLRDLVMQFFEWIADLLDSEVEEGDLSMNSRDGFSLPMPPGELFLLVGGLLLLGIVIHLLRNYHLAAREDEATDLDGEEGERHDPRDRSPGSHMDEAAELALQGRHRDALRALYLATLVALDRAHLIGFEPSRTNWHYLRQMPRGENRQLFARFTRLFDHKWYGDEPTTLADYELGRELTTRICAPRSDPGGST